MSRVAQTYAQFALVCGFSFLRIITRRILSYSELRLSLRQLDRYPPPNHRCRPL